MPNKKTKLEWIWMFPITIHVFMLSIIVFIQSSSLLAQKLYLNRTYAQLLNNPYSFSSTITTLPCATPLTVDPTLKSNAVDWVGVQFAQERGYVYRKFVSIERPNDCYQEKYPVFLSALNLDVSELYYWGRLQNQVHEFVTGDPL